MSAQPVAVRTHRPDPRAWILDDRIGADPAAEGPGDEYQVQVVITAEASYIEIKSERTTVMDLTQVAARHLAKCLLEAADMVKDIPSLR